MKRVLRLLVLWALLVCVQLFVHSLVPRSIFLPILPSLLLAIILETVGTLRSPWRTILPLALTIALVGEVGSGLSDGAVFLVILGWVLLLTWLVLYVLPSLTPLIATLLVFVGTLALSLALLCAYLGFDIFSALRESPFALLLNTVMLPAVFAMPLTFLFRHLLRRQSVRALFGLRDAASSTIGIPL